MMELKNKMLVAIPKKRGKRKGPFIFCHDVFLFAPNNAKISFALTRFIKQLILHKYWRSAQLYRQKPQEQDLQFP